MRRALRSLSLLPLVLSLALSVTVSLAQSTGTQWYWSYSELPYYTWDSEWYLCASGTLTSSSPTANFDGSYLATGITGTRTYYNVTGAYANSITSMSWYAWADNRFWPQGSSAPTLTSDGLSYTVSGRFYSVYGEQTSSGGINMYLQGSSAATGQIVEGDQPGGDTLTYLVISRSQSAIATCPSATPTVQTWSWMYTVTNPDNSYVCASGHLTTWLNYANGSYVVEDVQGVRYLYTSSGQAMTGIVGVAQPYSNGGNTNFIYATQTGASIVDTGGLAVVLDRGAAFNNSNVATSSTLVFRRNGQSVTEVGGPTPSSSTFTIVPWSASAAQCNSSSVYMANPTAYRSITVYNFIYTIQPYYTWDSEWQTCATGTMTVYTGQANADGSYNVMAITGTRRFGNTVSSQTLNITELIFAGGFEGNSNKVWINAPSSNGGLALDGGGISYKLNGTAMYANGGSYGGQLNWYSNGATLMEDDANGAPQDTKSQFIASTGTVPACPVLNTSLISYNFKYEIQPQNSNNFAVCVTGQLQVSTPNLDGGFQVLNINGATRYVYTVNGISNQGIGGTAAPYLNGYRNNNEFYTNGSSVFLEDGYIYTMYEPIQIPGNFSASYDVGITFVNGQFYEYEPSGASVSAGLLGTFQFSSTATYTCPTSVTSYGITQLPIPTPATLTAYFSYTLAPYYTWDSEWWVCASGTITASAQQNGDFSFTATNVIGSRVFANNSGKYTQSITGASTYDGGDSNFWLTNQNYLHPPVDLGGFSYAISGLGGQPLFPSGPNGQNAVNFYAMSQWPNTPNWFNTPSLSLAEDTGPTGDVVSSVVFSRSQSDTWDCTTQPVPQTRVWQFYYTQQANNNEYFVCGSGSFTTWVQNPQGGYLVIDAEGFRNFYVSNDLFFGSQYVFSTGIDGIYGPLEWSTNDNYIYPTSSGTAGVLDTNGLLMVAAPGAYFVPNWESNFIELRSNGNLIYEYLDPVVTTGTGITGTMQVWPYGSSSALGCNTTNPPSPFPAHVYWSFRYTMTPYYTWNDYWSVCASGVLTTAGWSAQDYVGAVPSGTAYAALAATGSRVFYNNTVNTGFTEQITGLLQPYDNDVAADNTNMIYPQSNGLDLGGLTLLLDRPPYYPAGYTPNDGTRVSVYNPYNGNSFSNIQERNGPNGDIEGVITFASVASASSTPPAAQQCSSLTMPQQRSYAFIYTINSSDTSNWQTCASGQLWTNYVAADGGQLVMEIRGSRYFNYPGTTYSAWEGNIYGSFNYPAFVQIFTGMVAPGGSGGNDNLVYPNRPAQYLSTNGVLVNTNVQPTQFYTGVSPFAMLNFASSGSNSNNVREFGGPSSGYVSSFQLVPVVTTGQNPTCKAPYTSQSTQTLYFSYTLTFSGGSICASGAITALNSANSDGSFSAIWISGFRSYNYQGRWTNATITGLTPPGSLTGAPSADNKVSIGTSGPLFTSTGLSYMTDNLIYWPGNIFDGSSTITVQTANGALTEVGGTGVTGSSVIVSVSPSGVTQCGSTSVTMAAGSSAPSGTAIPVSGSSSSSSGSNSNSGSSSSSSGSNSNSGSTSSSSSSSSGSNINSGSISSSSSSSAGGGGNVDPNADSSNSSLSGGAIAGIVIGSVVGALIILVVLLCLCGCLGISKSRSGAAGDTSSESSRITGNSNFTPMEESRRGSSNMEMSTIEPEETA